MGKSGKHNTTGGNSGGNYGRNSSGNSGGPNRQSEFQPKREGVFIDPFTDVGFKYLLGRPESRQVLIHFLNTLLSRLGIHITDIIYQNSEQIPGRVRDRRSLFDIYCITTNGEHIIVELQSQFQPFYVERGLFYSTIPLQRQSKRGNWNYNFSRVIVIHVLSDRMSPPINISKNVISVAGVYLADSLQLLTDKLAVLFVEMYNYSKSLKDLETTEDLWLYLLKNMGKMKEVPACFQKPPFEQLFKQARIANMDFDDYEAYLAEKKREWDENAIRTGGIMHGMEKGVLKKLTEFVLRLEGMGYELDDIVNLTGAEVEQVEKILHESSGKS